MIGDLNAQTAARGLQHGTSLAQAAASGAGTKAGLLAPPRRAVPSAQAPAAAGSGFSLASLPQADQSYMQSPYANETYLQSLNASSADTRRQVENVLQEIARQRQVAQQHAAQIPAAAGRVFDQARSSMAQDQSALEAAGGHVLAGASASPLAALAQQQASYGRAAGLMSQGFDEQAMQRQTSAGNIYQQLMADISSRANDYISGRQAEDRQRALQAEEAARQRALQEAAQRQAAELQAQLLAHQTNQAALDRLSQQQIAGLNRSQDLALYQLMYGANQQTGYMPSNVIHSNGVYKAAGTPTIPIKGKF